MDSANLLIWVHILAMSAYFGAQFAVIYMLLPVAEQAGDESRRRAALITGFKFYNPFTIAMLGIVVITGAMRLTDVKAEMKFEYFTRIWAALSLKLRAGVFAHLHPDLHHIRADIQDRAAGRSCRAWRRRAVHGGAAELDAEPHPRP